MESSSRTNRLAIFFGGILLIALLVFLAAASGLVWLFSCDGDAGYPYSARASQVGRMCSASQLGSGWTWPGIVMVTALAIALIGWIVSLVRRKFQTVLSVSIVSAFIIIATAIPGLVLDSQCTTEQWSTLPRSQCETHSNPAPD